MSKHRKLGVERVARCLELAASRGVSPRAYCIEHGWSYNAVYFDMCRAGLWDRIQAAKYLPTSVAALDVPNSEGAAA